MSALCDATFSYILSFSYSKLFVIRCCNSKRKLEAFQLNIYSTEHQKHRIKANNNWNILAVNLNVYLINMYGMVQYSIYLPNNKYIVSTKRCFHTKRIYVLMLLCANAPLFCSIFYYEKLIFQVLLLRTRDGCVNICYKLITDAASRFVFSY